MMKKKSISGNPTYSLKKLWKEYNDINDNGDVPFTVGLDDDNIFKWFLMIEGPEGTIYEGGVF